MFELRQDCRPVYSVKTRVIMQLEEFPATAKELIDVGCGSRTQVRRVLRRMTTEGGLVVIGKRPRRYALDRGATAYKLLRSGGNDGSHEDDSRTG